MREGIHPAAGHHVPGFITGPGETDPLFVFTATLLIASILGFGALLLTIHSLPERMAHKSKKVQMDIVAVLCLLALFSHVHAFWVAALLLALIDLPDFGTPVSRAVSALERMAGPRADKTAEPAGDA
jgi:hypothetical protein